MRVATLLTVLILMYPCVSEATEIEGKWGLGVAVGSLFSSSAEGSLIRGRSKSTAWILDLNATAYRDDRDSEEHHVFPDTTVSGSLTYESISIEGGPRLRQFLRPESSLSPYWDMFLHVVDTVNRQTYLDNSSYRETRVGGEVGIAIGAEYFLTRWPVSIGVHTDFATFSALHSSSDATANAGAFRNTSGTTFIGSVALHPIVQARVYF